MPDDEPFTPHMIPLRGRVLAAAEVDDAFSLFSPQGERLWVPGWEPEILYPAEGEWKEGQIFRTREEMGEAIWLISRLDPARYRVEYHRVEPGRYVARIEVSCRPVPGHGTEATIAYSYLGLSEAGNREITSMTQQAYDAKMSRWTEWISRHLKAHSRGGDA